MGTPPDEDGSADLQYVLAVASTIAEHMNDRKIIVNKSTVPVGTADKVATKVTEVLQKRGVQLEFSVASNPEFLKEGAAVNDCMRPDRIVVGTDRDYVVDTRTYALTALIKDGLSQSLPSEKLLMKSQIASLSASFLTR